MGAGLFGTPRDYLTFLQMLLHGGALRGTRILKPETIALMQQNHIGDLHVTEMKTSAPVNSRDFDQFPALVHKWGLSFDINSEPGPNGRSAGSISWGGLLNCYYWLDPTKRVTGAIFTQVLPFFDPDVLDRYAAFERGIYGVRGACKSQRSRCDHTGEPGQFQKQETAFDRICYAQHEERG